jgi:hypothetical protein
LLVINFGLLCFRFRLLRVNDCCDCFLVRYRNLVAQLTPPNYSSIVLNENSVERIGGCRSKRTADLVSGSIDLIESGERNSPSYTCASEPGSNTDFTGQSGSSALDFGCFRRPVVRAVVQSIH